MHHTTSTVMLAYISLLYDVERGARDLKLDREGRLALRQAKPVPIWTISRRIMERERPKVLAKSPEGQAISYTLSNWEALTRYAPYPSNWKPCLPSAFVL